MTSVGIVDLSEAVARAEDLAAALGQPFVVVGAIAMAAHGYRRQTSDVDIAMPVIVGKASGDRVEDVAHALGLEVRARHKFGGFDLRAKGVRIDVLTMDREVPELVIDAVQEAVAVNRRIDVFGHMAYAVSLGHLIAMKLVSKRKKDIGDIVELIKAQMEAGTWSSEHYAVINVVRKFVGEGRLVDALAADARAELGYDR